MKKWATQVKAIDPTNPERGVISWCGPSIDAISIKDAEKYCQENGLGYCEILGELTGEIPCKEGTYEPDWNKAINYNIIQNN